MKKEIKKTIKKPIKKTETKVYRLQVLKRYYDTEINKTMEIGQFIEVSEKRAKILANHPLKLVEIVEVK
jgi:hypothetical protein